MTILVGPNGTGKTNFVNALLFFREIAQRGLPLAVAAKGGFSRLRTMDEATASHVELAFDFSDSWDVRPETRYELSIGPDDDGYRVESESARYLAATMGPTGSPSMERIERHRAKLVLNGIAYGRPLPEGEAALGTLVEFAELGAPIAQFARNWKFYSLFPDALRDLNSRRRENILNEDAANWAYVIQAMKASAEGQARLGRIADAMRVVLPEYEDVEVSAVAGILIPTFILRRGNGKPQQFNANQVSDGTLRLFAILLALHQETPPGLLVLEEPELMVHPGVLTMLSEEFKEAAERMQIIVTTHSPDLVDQFAPEEVRVASISDGGSKISRVKQSQLVAVKKKLMSLKEFMSSEGLLPDESDQ
jgi:predicted ATPase